MTDSVKLTPKPVEPKKPNWISRILLAQDTADSLVSRQLCDQLRRSLLTDFGALSAPEQSTPERAKLFETAVALLAPPDAPWPDVYQAQKIRAHFVPDEALSVALIREIEEAETLKIDTTRIRQQITTQADPALTIAEKRELLVGLVSDMQWERKKRFACRNLRACYVKRSCYLTLLVGPFFFLSLMWTVWANDPQSLLYGFLSENLRYPGLVVATASGVLGAWFSMLVSTDKRLSGLRLDELRVVQRLISLIGRLIFGAAAAIIFYFLLQSELLTGDLLPEIDKIGFTAVDPTQGTDKTMRDLSMEGTIPSYAGSWLPTKNLCLLIVWGVICGFSEKLIPAALTRHADAAGNVSEGS